MSNMKIMIASPTTWQANPYTVNSYAYNLYMLGKAGFDIVEPKFFDDKPLSEARNKAINDPDKGLLASDCTHVMTWDTDQVFFNSNMVNLLKVAEHTDLPVVSGWYMATTGTGTPVIFKRDKKKILGNTDDFSYYKPYKLSEFFFSLKKTPTPFGNITKVDGIGMGLCVIKREVFEQIEYPWFLEWSPNMRQDIHHFGEDLWFCDKCEEQDIPIHVADRVYVGHFAKQGFVVGIEDLQAKAELEGIKKVQI